MILWFALLSTVLILKLIKMITNLVKSTVGVYQRQARLVHLLRYGLGRKNPMKLEEKEEKIVENREGVKKMIKIIDS